MKTIKEFTELIGVDGKWLAKTLGCTVSNANAIIRGETKLTPANVDKLRTTVSIPTEWIEDSIRRESQPMPTETREALAAYLKSRGMSLADISRMTGYTYQSTHDITHGRKPITRKAANAIGQALGVNPAWLMTGEGDMMSDDKPTAETYDAILATENQRLKAENGKLRAEIRRLRSQLGY